ncbi:uncharacterized protein LOC109707154 isoform X2 [Ananas comosus]|uniref:Uncharacterized protein LOC109707154 isoform X2 n=1 Tax=Ananas comosus TaxID=4615 RepID=A0A6P5EJY0_ANACO|nr:uncharacterized protein LOC109707154 isoform X2 [Ananas comosus]
MPPRLPDRRSRSRPRPQFLLLPLLLHRRHSWFLLLTLALLLLLLLLVHAAAPAALRRANALGRRCSVAASAVAGGGAEGTAGQPRRRRIAMVSFAAEEGNGGGGGGRRSFEGVMEAVEGNKRGYAARMGYDYVDARGAVDPRRPPSWSKILAVRSLLPSYDWVFWNDADTVITNPNISLESILLSAIGHSDFDASPDLVVTEDFGGINAGAYSDGDFMVHLAGIDDKKRWTAKILQEMMSTS